ncbi:MAG: hypothetical protein ACOC5G_04115 [Acidobacteriota bacterium]
MHTVIGALVFAEDPKEARQEARDIFEGLIDTTEFDYFTMFDEKYTMGTSGKDICPGMNPLALASSDLGKRMIEERIKTIEHLFKYAAERLIKKIEKNDYSVEKMWKAPIYGERDIRYECRRIGAVDGGDILLYTHGCEGIVNREELETYLLKDRLERKNTEDLAKAYKLYIVLCDVHF